jgi:hypothetical protein
MARWEDRRRRTETVEREACEGIQKEGKPCGNQRYADEPKRGRSQQRCSNMPSANAPGYVPCNDPRSNNEEYCGANNGVYSPHRVILQNRVILQIRWQAVGKQNVCAEAGRCSGRGEVPLALKRGMPDPTNLLISGVLLLERRPRHQRRPWPRSDTGVT